MRILVINGPNLNLLGRRQPEIYGRETLADIEQRMRARAGDLDGLELEFVQSNGEGELIDAVQQEPRPDGIVINAGAYTHTSLAIADAIEAVAVPTVEVHLSNVFKREPVRHFSHLSPVAWGVVAGFGYRSYLAALDLLHGRISDAAAERAERADR